MMKFYSAGASGNAYKVRILLALLRVPHEVVLLDLAKREHKTPEFLRLNPRGEVLIAFISDGLREPCIVIDEKSVTRLAGHIVRGEAPMEEDQRTRRASVMSLVRDLVAALSANDDPLLGLFGAFAYDLVFQIEDLVQKRAREADQRWRVCGLRL
jgi:hypothetical protein